MPRSLALTPSLSDLTALAYENALTGYDYRRFLRALSKSFGAASASLTQYNHASLKHIGTVTGVLERYVTPLRAREEHTLRRPLPMALFEPCILDLPSFDAELAEYGLVEAMSVLVQSQGVTSIYLTIYRTAEAGSFGEEAEATFTQLARNLASAMRLSQETGRVHYTNRAEELLNYLSFGILLFGRDGRLMGANRKGEAMLLEQGADFESVDGRLRLSEQSARRYGALVMKVSEDLQRPSLFDFTQEGAGPVLGLRLRDFHRDVPGPIALLHLPLRVDEAALGLLCRMYDLTAKESEVAQGLLAGHKVPQIAENLGMGYETARAHSKAVFAKCGVAGQGALILHVTPAIAALDWTSLSREIGAPYFG